MVDHVAKTLCRAAFTGISCPVCDSIDQESNTFTIGECMLWPTFRIEALAAIEAVRDYARLDMRRHPRQRAPIDVARSVEG